MNYNRCISELIELIKEPKTLPFHYLLCLTIIKSTTYTTTTTTSTTIESVLDNNKIDITTTKRIKDLTTNHFTCNRTITIPIRMKITFKNTISNYQITPLANHRIIGIKFD